MKFLLCAFCTLFTVAFAFPAPSNDVPSQCRDPTFACQDLQSARLCKTVSPCIHDVWATMRVPEDNDEICDICKEMVKEARDQLLSNMTQEEIKEVFEGSCKLLPIKIVANACIKVVDEIIPELVEMLASRMDPTMVCTVSGMCFATLDEHSLEGHVYRFFKNFVLKPKGTQCNECKTMLTDVQVFLNSSTEAEVKTYLEQFCGEKIPHYLCDIIMNTYFSSIYQEIKTSDPEKMCGSVGICPNKLDDGRPAVNDDLTCEFCEHLLQHVKDLITTNTTMEEFRTALLNFCKHTKYADKCTKMVNEYYDMLFTYIKQLDTKGMCTLMGLCSNSQQRLQPMVELFPAQEMRKPSPQIKLTPAEKVSNMFTPLVNLIPSNVASKKRVESNEIFPAVNIEKFSHPLSIFQQDADCALCTAFAFYLEKDLGEDRSKEGIRDTISHVCEKWMVSYPEECSKIVSMHSTKIELALAKGCDFKNLCSLLKVCPLEQDKTGELNVRVLQKVQERPFCGICKDAMNAVEKELSDPATKQKLEDLLSQVCNILPDSMKDDCRTFISQNVDAVIDTLEQELKPDNICPAIGLCDASLRVPAPQRIKDLECDVCKDVVAAFRKRLEDPASKEIVQTFLEEGCARLPQSVAAECKKFVDENIDAVMTIILSEMDPDQVCAILKICPASLRALQKTPKVTDVECEACKAVIGELESLAKSQDTQDEIKKALDRLCSYLPSHLGEKCTSLVNQYSEILVEFVIEQLDPDKVCGYIKLCPANLAVKVPKVKDVECDLCKEVIQKVEDMVKDEKTEDEIKSALDKVCSYLPSSLNKKCADFVNQYTDLIVNLLMQELDPDMVCAELKLCPSNEVAKAPKVKDVECDLCKEAIQKIEDMVKDGKTEDAIKSALDKVCSYLPSSLSSKCENFVNQYTSLIITLLMQELDPDMVCAELKVCPMKDMECEYCQEALHFLQNQLMSADVQAELKNVLKRVCDVLPEKFADNCEAFVEEYGSALLAIIAQEIDPSTLCVQFQACPGNQTAPHHHVTAPPTSLDGCSVCTTVVDYVDKLLEEDSVDQELTHLVERVCGVVPSLFRDKCSDLLEAYGPYILQMIGQVADSKQLCQEIDLCPRAPGHVHLIGGHKCTFGPSYWCASQAHAAACKAQEFCETKVWKTVN